LWAGEMTWSSERDLTIFHPLERIQGIQRNSTPFCECTVFSVPYEFLHLAHLKTLSLQTDLYFLGICGVQDHDRGRRITVEGQVGVVHVNIAV